jgi:hypothetical protein
VVTTGQMIASLGGVARADELVEQLRKGQEY